MAIYFLNCKESGLIKLKLLIQDLEFSSEMAQNFQI